MMEIRNLFHKAGSKWPTYMYDIQRKNKKHILRNSRENNARGVHNATPNTQLLSLLWFYPCFLYSSLSVLLAISLDLLGQLWALNMMCFHPRKCLWGGLDDKNNVYGSKAPPQKRILGGGGANYSIKKF